MTWITSKGEIIVNRPMKDVPTELLIEMRREVNSQLLNLGWTYHEENATKVWKEPQEWAETFN